LRSCFIYEGPIRKAIHQLKFNGELALGETLARPLADLYRRMNWDVDLIVPVPNSLARRKMRGYNQASLLALPVALSAGVAYTPDALVKLRETRSQVGLSALERQQNVFGAFLARKERVAERSVLIIDDIRTSGATMEACASAVMAQGARQVYGLTLARAVLDTAINSSY
jgi:ComF family protein